MSDEIISYYDKTWSAYKLLQDPDTKISHDPERRVLLIRGGDDIEEIQAANSRIFYILFDGELSKQRKQEYARRLGTSPNELSMNMTGSKGFRSPQRDVVLRALLARKDIPDENDVNHILMEIKRPGVYIRTWDRRENMRNQLIDYVFRYARRENLMEKRRDWIAFFNHALHYYAMEKGMQACAQTDNMPGFDAEEVSVFAEWKSGINSVSSVNLAVFRGKMLERIEGKTKTERYYTLQEKLLERCGIKQGVEMIQSFFGSSTNPNSRVGRSKIIEYGIALGCSFDEINVMLLEANQALLYPRQSDKQELEDIRRIQRYEGKI